MTTGTAVQPATTVVDILYQGERVNLYRRLGVILSRHDELGESAIGLDPVHQGKHLGSQNERVNCTKSFAEGQVSALERSVASAVARGADINPNTTMTMMKMMTMKMRGKERLGLPVVKEGGLIYLKL